MKYFCFLENNKVIYTSDNGERTFRPVGISFRTFWPRHFGL